MTYKAAAAGLDLGGGKAVLCASPDRELTAEERRNLMLDLGDVVESLEGRYVPAEDVGRTPGGIAVIAGRRCRVVGVRARERASGDRSPVSARGVERAIRASGELRYGSGELDVRTVAVIGLGHVGLALAKRLRAAGAELIASDIDTAKRPAVERLGGRWV